MVYGACQIGGCNNSSIDFNVILVIGVGVIILGIIIYTVIKKITKHKK